MILELYHRHAPGICPKQAQTPSILRQQYYPQFLLSKSVMEGFVLGLHLLNLMVYADR